MHSLAAAAAHRKKEENAEDGKLQTPKTDDTLKNKRPPKPPFSQNNTTS